MCAARSLISSLLTDATTGATSEGDIGLACVSVLSPNVRPPKKERVRQSSRRRSQVISAAPCAPVVAYLERCQGAPAGRFRDHAGGAKFLHMCGIAHEQQGCPRPESRSVR